LVGTKVRFEVLPKANRFGFSEKDGELVTGGKR